MNDSEFTNSGEGSLCHCERSEVIQNPRPRSCSSLRSHNSDPARKGWGKNAPQEVTNLFTYSLNNLLTSKRAAFTLAEILITLAIIGIVAALTIPTLISNYQKRVFVTRLQKVYSQMANAAKMVMADEQVDNLNNTYLYCNWDTDDKCGNGEYIENTLGHFFNTYFKVAKTCQGGNITECIASKYNALDGGVGVFPYGSTYFAILQDGSVIGISYFDADYPMIIDVDLNGKNGPNVLGRDAFELAMNFRGEIAENFTYKRPEFCDEGSEDFTSTGRYGMGCFDKIIQEGWKMDY